MASYLRGEAARQVWRERLGRYERSGLTAKDFCAQEEVSLPSFYQWKRRLRSANEDVPMSGPKFQPVQIVADSMASVEFLGVATLRIPSSQASLVRAVVAELAVVARKGESC